ncbi:hypothetical protein B296_00037912 [Ensete ventricosum]|uniref:Aspartic peptidase DDI1-type domain-containing protein n=1 Tax=Ensete ventricosum TaxID=4639 RepID=A0A426XMD0_ENSVE|nr:hypothetical protein B296_00037912 [Ensete ventricosum]
MMRGNRLGLRGGRPGLERGQPMLRILLDSNKDLQLTDCMVHALASYVNPQMMKIGGFLKQQPITILVDTGSTNNFIDSKVAARSMLQIKDYSRFNITVVDGPIFHCNPPPRVKLVLQGQEITTDFVLLPLENYEAVLGIEWLSLLGDVF